MAPGSLPRCVMLLGTFFAAPACLGRTGLDARERTVGQEASPDAGGPAGGAGGMPVTGGGGTEALGGNGGDGGATVVECVDGELACASGDHIECVSPMRDASNCGACGRTCAAGAYCDDGECRARPCTGSLSLGGPPLIQVAGWPSAIALGDLDGDGRVDLAAATADSDAPVAVRYGTGAGRFTEKAPYGGPAAAVNAIAIADLDANGTDDLVVTDPTTNAVYVHLDGGDGSDVGVEVGTRPSAVATGDFDGDARLDLAVTNEGSGSVSVLLQGSGPQALSPRTDYPTFPAPHALAAGDVNGDGALDLVVGFRGATGAPSGIHVLAGTGDGGFAAPIDYPFDDSVRDVCVADLTQDGVSEILVGMRRSETVRVLSDALGGAPVLVAEYDVGSEPVDVQAADLNADGWPDVVTANQSTIEVPASVSVLLNAGDGTLRVHEDYPYVRQPVAVAAGDVTGDGAVDLVVASYGWRAASVLVGRGDGTFVTPQVLARTGGKPSAPQLWDFEGDGDLDLAVAVPGAAEVELFSAQGGGTFALTAALPAAADLSDLVAVDLNGDDRRDLVFAAGDSRQLGVILARADGGYEPFAGYPTTPIATIFGGPQALAVGDLDDDGVVDLVTVNYDTDPVPSTLNVFLGLGDGTFAPRVEYPAAKGPVDVAMGDLTGDGILDLAVSNGYSSTTTVFPGLGDGTFDAMVEQIPSGWGPLALGDFDRDGRLDIAATASGGAVRVLLARPDGTLSYGGEYPSSAHPCEASHLIVTDLDLDRRADLVVAHAVNLSPPAAETVGVLLGNGDGTFAAPLDFAGGLSASGLAIADLDADGRPHLVVTNAATDEVVALRNSCE